jgi:antitoxin component YwqK of YwqJK toxin-antitoxin module
MMRPLHLLACLLPLVTLACKDEALPAPAPAGTSATQAPANATPVAPPAVADPKAGESVDPSAAPTVPDGPPKVVTGRVQTPEKAEVGQVVNVKEFFENGQLATERSERKEADGKYTRVGPMKAWFENGQLRCEGGYDERGKLTGHWRYFSEAGQLLREGDFADGQREGDWTEFYENGQKRSAGLVHVGQCEGPWRYWHENGKPAAEGTYVNNFREGAWMFWDEQGVPDAARCGEYVRHNRIR